MFSIQIWLDISLSLTYHHSFKRGSFGTEKERRKKTEKLNVLCVKGRLFYCI